MPSCRVRCAVTMDRPPSCLRSSREAGSWPPKADPSHSPPACSSPTDACALVACRARVPSAAASPSVAAAATATSWRLVLPRGSPRPCVSDRRGLAGSRQRDLHGARHRPSLRVVDRVTRLGRLCGYDGDRGGDVVVGLRSWCSSSGTIAAWTSLRGLLDLSARTPETGPRNRHSPIRKDPRSPGWRE